MFVRGVSRTARTTDNEQGSWQWQAGLAAAAAAVVLSPGPSGQLAVAGGAGGGGGGSGGGPLTRPSGQLAGLWAARTSPKVDRGVKRQARPRARRALSRA